MAHPLEDVIREADGLLLIGESGKDRFPAFSYHAYTAVGKRPPQTDPDARRRELW
jgi:hypothetical protein